jgi:phosphonate transport system substrate-binding protein
LDRRQLLVIAATVLTGFARIARAANEPLRFGLTPVFLDSDVQLLAALQRYLEDRLHCPVELIKRRTYQEITLLLLSGQLDAAWICGFPFVQYREQLALVPVPLYRGQPLYQSYLTAMPDNERGRAILELLRLDGFTRAEPSLFDGIAAKYEAVRSAA